MTAQFIQQWIAADHKQEQHAPPLEWHEGFSAAQAAVRALFKQDTFEIFKDFERKIDPDLGAVDPRSGRPHPSVDRFIEARDRAVKALYSEVI